MSTYWERHAEALEELRTIGFNCIGCRLGVCTQSHDNETEDDE